MANKYALISGMRSSPPSGLVFKVYRVKDVRGEGSSVATAIIEEPIIGQFFTLKSGNEERIPSGQVFDSVEEAVDHARKLIYSMRESSNKDEVINITPLRLFEAIFANYNNDKILKSVKNFLELKRQYSRRKNENR